MLKRSSPRFRSASVIWNGNSFTVAPDIFPVKNASSSCSVPRATVPARSGRALDPSANSALGRSGLYFGWLCISCRHPLANTRQTNAAAVTLRFDVIDLPGSETLQEGPSLLTVELRVIGFNRQEQAVLARMF